MYISILTLFPEIFQGPFDCSIVKRAQSQHHLNISYINIRDFSEGSYKTVDDHPYGGGQGMILRVDILDRALQHAKSLHPHASTRTILLDPQGTPYTQKEAKKLSGYEHIILICGHYEGVDERVRALVDEEISIGDYIVTGGEIPAMVIVDSVARLLPGVLPKPNTTTDESFANPTGLLEYPQYTRPATYNKVSVPSVLLSGNHKAIALWRREQAKKRTKRRRPDLTRTS
ncbi:tRNA (guanosine(37)-N1)-methyltransferase TrmD [Candidatus Gottesmanbacteria bacterium RBG_13_45_10]|uniref:tRNA (guanine-N(1)-)-methyltransferase n=1 Tax=Candidatus Gottesmanbacteria bacterium RBG_13_45_10 TaxID=1798370 RepID=A0A1F5ZGQ1_9BACT|nr:MAG: tRNA (guanosine(37)-N1)-methyltransferase TrmD [Candidatus Gottesmanbacteria bacterium RBG_13_45_10]